MPMITSLARARAERDAARRAELMRRREVLIAALDRACENSTLSPDDVAAALLIVGQRRARREGESNARRRWPLTHGRAFGEF
jgi:hypothetical protein